MFVGPCNTNICRPCATIDSIDEGHCVWTVSRRRTFDDPEIPLTGNLSFTREFLTALYNESFKKYIVQHGFTENLLT